MWKKGSALQYTHYEHYSSVYNIVIETRDGLINGISFFDCAYGKLLSPKLSEHNFMRMAYAVRSAQQPKRYNITIIARFQSRTLMLKNLLSYTIIIY